MTAARPSGVISQFCGLARSLWVMPARRSRRNSRSASRYQAGSAGRARCSGVPSLQERTRPSASVEMSCGVPAMPLTTRNAAISRRASTQASGRDHHGAAETMRRITGRAGSPARCPLCVSEKTSRLSTVSLTKSAMAFLSRASVDEGEERRKHMRRQACLFRRFGKSRIVDISVRPAFVEGFLAPWIERRAKPDTPRQIRIGDEKLAERGGVGLALGEQLRGGLGVQAFVGDIDAAEGLLERRAEARFRLRFPRHDEGDLAPA